MILEAQYKLQAQGGRQTEKDTETEGQNNTFSRDTIPGMACIWSKYLLWFVLFQSNLLPDILLRYFFTFSIYFIFYNRNSWFSICFMLDLSSYVK